MIYKLVNNSSKLINCFFTDNLHLAYRVYCSRVKNGDEIIEKLSARQCCYCDKYIANYNTVKKHIKSYSDVTGIVYIFENNKIFSFQNNFKYIGDLPFVVYFDFETTTGDSILHDSKMFVISYCQICSFHPDLKLDKIIIFVAFNKQKRKFIALVIFHKDT